MGYTLAELSQHLGASCVGDPSYRILGVADLVSATPSDLSFFGNPRYHQQMVNSQAGAIIVRPDCVRDEGRRFLVHGDPSAAFQRAMLLFRLSVPPHTGFSGIHPTAVIHPGARVGVGVTVGPYAVLDDGVSIGDRTYIGSHVFIGPQSSVGADSFIHPHVVIREGCTLGRGVIVQPGAIIGSCGFGYTTDDQGIHRKLEQLGGVQVADHVEIGANTTIDRARFAATSIGEGTKIDNLVQIAHNVEVGAHSIIVAQVGIAGSTKVGSHVILGGQVAVNGHISLCDHVRVTACSAISKSLTKPGDYGGVPARPLAEHNRNAVCLRHIHDLFHRVRLLEQALDQLNGD